MTDLEYLKSCRDEMNRIERGNRMSLALGYVLVIIIFGSWIWSNQAHSEVKTDVVCGTVYVYRPSGAFRLDPVTNRETPAKDGVYHTEKPWCLYSIVNGFPREIDRDEGA